MHQRFPEPSSSSHPHSHNFMPAASPSVGSAGPEKQSSTYRPRKRFSLIALTTLIIALIAILFTSTSLRGALASRALTTSLFKPTTTPITRSDTTTSFPKMVNKVSAEDRQWNALADGMDRFHNHFRYEFNRVYTLCDGGFHKEGMSLTSFIREAQQLYQHLDMHHRIEAYIFPILAKKMPQFKAGARESGEHLKSHKAIHDGLEKYEEFLKASLANPKEYSATTLRGIMDGFRDVLFRHLDEEVHDLGAESMKAAGWTLAEIRQIPM